MIPCDRYSLLFTFGKAHAGSATTSEDLLNLQRDKRFIFYDENMTHRDWPCYFTTSFERW